jgi:hypothetical protein
MFARKIIPAAPASQSRTDAGPYANPFPRTAAAFMGDFALDLDLPARIADLDAQIARWHANQDEAADIDADEAEYQALLDAEADALADAQDAGDLDADGEPVEYDRYRSA